ncbi:MAG: hypothetical protein V9H69_07665 [Anaerolineae bacterium]
MPLLHALLQPLLHALLQPLLHANAFYTGYVLHTLLLFDLLYLPPEVQRLRLR